MDPELRIMDGELEESSSRRTHRIEKNKSFKITPDR